MLDEISSSQLSEWEHYAEEEPLERQEYLLALIVSAIYSYLRADGEPAITAEQVLYPQPIPKKSREAEIASDLAFVEALVASGKVVDMRDKIKPKKGG